MTYVVMASPGTFQLAFSDVGTYILERSIWNIRPEREEVKCHHEGNPPNHTSQYRPTILDVARRANVSKSLVSMVTRGEEGVSPESRKAVLKAIADLDYRPNLMARGLVQRRSRLFGVMISTLRNPFFSSVVSGIQDRANELGYQVLFNTGDRDPVLEERAIESLLQLRVDGLILASPRVDDAVVARAAASVPVVVLNRETTDDATDSVTNDNFTGARLAVEHLVGLRPPVASLLSPGGRGRREHEFAPTAIAARWRSLVSPMKFGSPRAPTPRRAASGEPGISSTKRPCRPRFLPPTISAPSAP